MDAVSRSAAAARLAHGVPGLAVGVGRAGVPVHVEGLGLADVGAGRAVVETTQFRIGSVTKTFTAALVTRLAGEGVLDLDAPVSEYLTGTNVGAPRLRQLLAHIGGVQREAPGDMWSTMQGPDDAGLVDALAVARMVDRPGARWHYSNLGYAILGHIVRGATGRRCEDLIDERLLGPLGLTSTTWQPMAGAAAGYRLDPYDETLHPEPLMQQGTVGVGGQLWSTVPDLLAWGDALLGGAPQVLPDDVTASMWTPQVMVDRRSWTTGWGLGLILDRRDGRVVAGHTGAMPGFLAALALDRDGRTVVAALANVTRGIPLAGLAATVLDDVRGSGGDAVTEPADRPTTCPPDLRDVLGRWWCEAEEHVFTWRRGALHAHLADAPASTETAFEATHEPGTFVATAGRFQGELLHVVRDRSGRVDRLEWATYPFTRDPR